MSLAFLGSLTLSVAVPGAASVASAGAAGINGALPDIESRLASLGDFTPAPISFAADLALAQSVVAGVTLAIATPGLTPPDISAQLAIIAALVASLEAQIGAVNAELGIVTDFLAVLATGGVFGYAYAGRADGIGSAISAELAGGFPGGTGADAANALVLATTTPATWGAMQTLFKTS
jgi:hypothetical protein